MAKITPKINEDIPSKNWIQQLNSPKVTVLLVLILGILFIYVVTSEKGEETPKILDRSVTKAPENTPPNTGDTSMAPSGDLSSIDVNSGATTESDVLESDSMADTVVSGNAVLPIVPPTTSTSTDSVGDISQSGGLATYFEQYAGKDTPYYQAAVGYGFIIPKGTYYQGFGAKDGATHSVAFMTGTGVTDWDSASTRLWFYKKSIPSELGSVAGNYYEDPSKGTIYFRVGSGAIKIEGNAEDPLIQSIIQSIKSE